MLKFFEIFEFSRENSYFERIRMVRMVRMVRSLDDRTFQRRLGPLRGAQPLVEDVLVRVEGLEDGAPKGRRVEELVVPADLVRTPVNNFELILVVNNFHKIQNFRQISDLFSQI